MSTIGRVFLVGAGPGHPGLLTLRAVQCLAQADVVLYDTLVPEAMLSHAPAHAERIRVSEFGPRHAERCGSIQQKLIDAARQGKCVVRLKGGDPFLFGRGGEEAEALRDANIPFEVVPGVTAALGAAAFAGIPLTHRTVASAVAIVTGHESPDQDETHLDWHNLTHFPGTLAIYMGLGRLAAIAQTLIQHGKPPDTPAAVVYAATTGAQKTVTAPLKAIAATVEAVGFVSPSLILVGPVVALREHLNWFDHLPLRNRRILICRPRAQAAELARRLEELGAIASVLPVVEIQPPTDWAPVDAAISRLREYQWLVFTSVNGVGGFFKRLVELGRDLRAIGHVRLAAIGSATAAALRELHLEPDVVPEVYQSEGLAAALKPLVVGQRVLLAIADRGRELLHDELQSVAQVDQVAVYSQVDVTEPDQPALKWLRAGEVDEVILTSPKIARSLASLLDETGHNLLRSGRTRIVSISPLTSAAVRELGWPVAAEAEEATMEGMVRALLALPNNVED